MKQFGLIGYPLSHSFSEGYFTEKFRKEGISGCNYKALPIDNIDKFPDLIDEYPNLVGLNVTIPYKQQVMQYLDEIKEEAAVVGAVNTVKFEQREGKRYLCGYNSDVYGFEMSLGPMLKDVHKKALILGTGGASKAVKYVLNKLGIEHISASIEELQENEIRYEDITPEMIGERMVIINCTPLGTYPKVDGYPQIPYEYITSNHVLFDLVYNPEVTRFLQFGKDKGAATRNGLEMLHGQAERSWTIWNS